MKLSRLVEVSRVVSATRSRKKKTHAIAQLLREAEAAEVGLIVSYLSGDMPQGRIGLGYAAVHKVGSATLALPLEGALTLEEVDRTLSNIKSTGGSGSTGRKRSLLGGMLDRGGEEERRFLKSLVLGELRQGALVGIMVEAIAEAYEAEAREVRRAVMLAGEAAAVAGAVALRGPAALREFSLEVLKPIQPMLASPSEDPEAALARLGEAAVELKLDGARIQAHKDGDEVRLFSRGLHDVTNRAPEVVDAVRAVPFRRAVLDGEAIAFRADGRPHSFQTTMRRFGRKLDVERMQGELPLRSVFFDALLLDDEELLDAPLRRRDEALREAVSEDGRIERRVTSDLDDLEAFYADAIDRGHEGLMAKSLDSTYEAGSRGFSWLKLKPAHTLDLVILAAEWGSGRRQGWLSNLHLGARDPASGGFVMLGKTFKGMTDAMLAWQTEALQRLATGGRDGWVVPVRPELVAEIAFNDVMTSPQYPGGLALRFARVKRYRPDKSASDASTIDEVRALHAD